jgi:hypothetical protein
MKYEMCTYLRKRGTDLEAAYNMAFLLANLFLINYSQTSLTKYKRGACTHKLMILTAKTVQLSNYSIQYRGSNKFRKEAVLH